MSSIVLANVRSSRPPSSCRTSPTTVMDALSKSLAELGLGVHEARVYALLVESSPAGAAQIAKRAGLPRSSVYTTLEILQEKGLVGITHHDGVKQFVVEGHAALLDHLKRERERAESRIAAAER